MNRQDVVAGIAYLEQVAADISARAAELREQLAADARAEYEEQKTAPTWRIPGVATVTANVSQRSVYVADPKVFAKWVAQRYPTEVEPAVRTVWQKTFLGRVRADDDGPVYDPASDGEVVPGLAVREGGQFRSIAIRVSADGRDLFTALAEATTARMLATSDLPALQSLAPPAEVPQ